jgi:hypothetical protein
MLGYPHQYNGAIGDFAYGDSTGAGLSGWREERFDLTKYKGKSNIKVQFNFVSDMSTASPSQPGWFIDDLSVVEQTNNVALLAPFTGIIAQDNFDTATGIFGISSGSEWRIASPTATHSGASPQGGKVAGVGMVAGAYPPNMSYDRLKTTSFVDFTGVNEAGIFFMHWFDIDIGAGTLPLPDGVNVAVAKEGTNQWFEVGPRVMDWPSSPGAYQELFTITALGGAPGWGFKTELSEQVKWRRGFIDLNQAIKNVGRKLYIAWQFASDPANQKKGYALDDVKIVVK